MGIFSVIEKFLFMRPVFWSALLACGFFVGSVAFAPTPPWPAGRSLRGRVASSPKKIFPVMNLFQKVANAMSGSPSPPLRGAGLTPIFTAPANVPSWDELVGSAQRTEAGKRLMAQREQREKGAGALQQTCNYGMCWVGQRW